MASKGNQNGESAGMVGGIGTSVNPPEKKKKRVLEVWIYNQVNPPRPTGRCIVICNHP